MVHSSISGEAGQILVTVALAILVLLAFVALAVDVGNVYAERRAMQNAADAGALAGAREICLGNGEGAAMAMAYQYAVDRNGADGAMTSISIVTGTVTVVAQEEADTYFAGLVGFPSIEVSARAVALCGPARGGSHLWPIAVVEESFAAQDCGEDNELVIIDDDKTCGEDYDCDLDDDGDDDVIMGGNRGWLDFAQPDAAIYGISCGGDCGAAALKCWIENPSPEEIIPPMCIKGEGGVKTSAFMAAGDYDGGQVAIPLFDEVVDTGDCPHGHPTYGVDCPNSRLYHIIDFGCVEVVRFEKKFELTSIDDGEIDKFKALIVTKVCNPTDCFTPGGGAGGGEFIPGGLTAVSLIE